MNKMPFLILSLFCAMCLSSITYAEGFHLENIPFHMVDKMELNFKNELSREYNKARVLKTTPQVNLLNVQTNQEDSMMDQFLELTRINILIGAFTALDLKVVEFRIQPYVEFRFDK